MGSLEAVRADITKERTDAIVNAANSRLAHGGGVAKAIADAAGPELLAESRRAPSVPTGTAYPTTAGDLNARWVIHAVGPIWKGGLFNERRLLASAYRDALRVAAEIGAVSVSFPSISTGIYSFPIRQAAPIAVNAVAAAMNEYGIDRVRFCLFTERDLGLYQSELGQLWSEQT